MSLLESLHTNSKYGVLIITAGIVAVVGFIATYEIFNLYGKVFGGISAVIFIAIILGIVNSFKDNGYKQYTFEEAVLRNTPESAISNCIVRIKDPEYGKIWFMEKGKLIVTQVGAMFFYGWPFINGHKILTINTINAQEAAGVIIDFESPVGPEATPDGLWFDTATPIKLKGNKILDYQEQRNIVSAYEMVQKQGQINRMRFSGDVPALQKTGVSTISLDELTSRDA
jgi:hypothetical protein